VLVTSMVWPSLVVAECGRITTRLHSAIVVLLQLNRDGHWFAAPLRMSVGAMIQVALIGERHVRSRTAIKAPAGKLGPKVGGSQCARTMGGTNSLDAVSSEGLSRRSKALNICM